MIDGENLPLYVSLARALHDMLSTCKRSPHLILWCAYTLRFVFQNPFNFCTLVLTEQEIITTKRQVEEYGYTLPSFGKIGGILAKEVING